MRTQWWKSERVRGGATAVLALVAVLAAGGSLTAPTNWLLVITSSLLALFLAADAYLRLTGQLTRVVPGDVKPADVDHVITENDNEIAAIKALREKYRGLGLSDAVRLVRERRTD